MEVVAITQIEPRLKHPIIFQKQDYIAEKGEIFGWEYLLEGSNFWEVKISKLIIGEKATSLGELVADDYRKATVLGKFGLDFSCGGKKSPNEACKEKHVHLENNILFSKVIQLEKELLN
ncbi:MAG: DUF542 domain-containing protein [Lutibacter sp.]|nr:DUF542 domain-containing protein [Lutibacter sp.]